MVIFMRELQKKYLNGPIKSMQTQFKEKGL